MADGRGCLSCDLRTCRPVEAMSSVEQDLWLIFTYYTLHGNPLDPEHMRVRAKVVQSCWRARERIDADDWPCSPSPRLNRQLQQVKVDGIDKFMRVHTHTTAQSCRSRSTGDGFALGCTAGSPPHYPGATAARWLWSFPCVW